MFCRHFRSVCNHQNEMLHYIVRKPLSLCCHSFTVLCLCEWGVEDHSKYVLAVQGRRLLGAAHVTVSVRRVGNRQNEMLHYIVRKPLSLSCHSFNRSVSVWMRSGRSFEYITELNSRFKGDDCWGQHMLPCQYFVLKCWKPRTPRLWKFESPSIRRFIAETK